MTRGVPLVDLRDAAERAGGMPEGATELGDTGDVAELADRLLGDREDPLLLICARGIRSTHVARRLRAMGFAGVVSVAGGVDAWRAAGLPVAGLDELSAAEAERYARHLVLPEVGTTGQARLGQARMLLIGAGGLGSPAGLYLAAAGIGTLGVVDNDRVERSNLQRQVLHLDASVGQRKVDSAAQRLEALNPGVRVERFDLRVDRGNAADLLAGWDIVVDGSDNFATRYALNDAAMAAGIPVVHGSVERFAGQVILFPPGGPCYRCLYPDITGADEALDCATAGVLGVLPGVIGTLQATEAIKWVVSAGHSLAGRLLRFDALTMSFRESRLRRDPACPACGKEAG